MASLRALGSTPRLATQRFTHVYGLAHSSSTTLILPGALSPRLSLATIVSHARFTSQPRVTAFEQAMREVYGEDWKGKLNCRQRSFVKLHERLREKSLPKAAVDGLEDAAVQAEDRQPEYQWRKKVEKKKAQIRRRNSFLNPHLPSW